MGTHRPVSNSDSDRQRRALTAPRPGITRRRTRWGRAAAWTAFAVGAAAAFAFVVSYRYVTSGVFAEEVRRTVVAQLHQALGREVQLGGVAGDFVHGVSLRDLRIAEQGGFVHGVAFAADEVRLWFDWPSLLTVRPDVASIIRQAHLVSPRLVLTRNAQGAWNLSDVLARRGTATTARFRGPVLITNGSVDYSDVWNVPSPPFVARFSRVNGNADVRRGDEIGLALTGSSPDGEQVRLVGRVRTDGRSSEFDITAANAASAHWGGYFVRVPGLDWERGRFGGQVHVVLTPAPDGLALDFSATLRLHDTDLRYRPKRLSLRQVSGPIAVDRTHAETSGLAGRANGSPLIIDGNLVYAGGPWVQIGLRSPDLDLATVQALFFPKARITLVGTAAADLKIIGPIRGLDVDGEIVAARGRLNGQGFTGLHARMEYVAGMLTFTDLKSSVAGGRLAGNFVLDVTGGTPSYLFSGTTNDVDVAALSSMGLTGLNGIAGRISGHMVGVGTGTQAHVMGDVTMGPGSVRGLTFDGAHAIFWHDGTGRVDLDYVSGRIGTGTVFSSGRIGADGTLDLDVFAHDLSLSDLGARSGVVGGGKVPLDGRADLLGRATGTTAAPALTGAVTVSHGRVGRVAYAHARGDVTITPRGLTAPRLDVQNGTALYHASGGITFRPLAADRLHITGEEVDAQWLAGALPLAPDITGRLSAALTIDGSLSRPSVAGNVVLDRGSVNRLRIDHATASLTPDPGHIRIADAEARVNGSRLAASGTIDPGGPLDLRLSAENVHLADIDAVLGLRLPAEGTLALSGEVHGTIQNPVVSGQVTAPKFVVGGETFRASGAMDYEGGVLRLSGLQLTQGTSRYRLSGEIRPGPSPSLGLALDVDQGRVATVLSAAGINLPAPLDGRIDGRIELSGPLDDPSARLSLTLRDATFGTYAIGDGVADLTLTHQTIDIDRLEIHPAQGQVAAKGRVDLRGSNSVEISAQDLNPDFLRPFLPLDRPLEGRLNFTLQFSGTIRDPKAGLSLEASEAGVSGVVADRIAALAFYSGGTLTLEQGTISKGPHKVVAIGTLPVDPHAFALDTHGPVQLQLHLQDADLSFLSLVSPKFTDAAGTVEGEITVGGSIGAPRMGGFLRSQGGRLHYEALRTPLEALNIDVSFSQDQIEVRDLSATLGAGRAAAEGTVGVTNFRPNNIQMALRADHATLDIPGLYRGQVDADLKISGPATRPTASGRVTLSNGVVSPGGSAAGAGGIPGGDLGLDITLEAGPKTAFTLGAIRAEVEGGVHVGGTLAHPLLSGRVTAPEGEVAFLGSTFRLTGGEAVFSESRGVEPQISARAQQVYGETVVFLDVNGPATHPDLLLTASPPLSQEEIVTLVARNAGLLAPESVLGQGVGGSLLGTIREALHLNEFTVAYSRESPVTLRVGKYLLQNLYLTLSEVWPAPPGATLTPVSLNLGTFNRQVQPGQSYAVAGLEYFLNPNLLLTFNVDTLGGTGVFALTRFPL